MSERSKRSLTRRCPSDTWEPRVDQDNHARTGAAPGAGSCTRTRARMAHGTLVYRLSLESRRRGAAGVRRAPSSNIANPSKYHITRRIICAIVRIQSKIPCEKGCVVNKRLRPEPLSPRPTRQRERPTQSEEAATCWPLAFAVGRRNRRTSSTKNGSVALPVLL